MKIHLLYSLNEAVFSCSGNTCSEKYAFYYDEDVFEGVVHEKGLTDFQKSPFIGFTTPDGKADTGMLIPYLDQKVLFSKVEVGDSIYKLKGSLRIRIFKPNGAHLIYDINNYCCRVDRSGCSGSANPEYEADEADDSSY